MTVKELIDKLSEFPDELDVRKLYVGSEYNEYDDIDSVEMREEYNWIRTGHNRPIWMGVVIR